MSDETVTLRIEEAKARKQVCQYPSCEQLATGIAQGRESWSDEQGLPLAFYCEVHAESAADQGSPEYTVHCPNCGCKFGVN